MKTKLIPLAVLGFAMSVSSAAIASPDDGNGIAPVNAPAPDGEHGTTGTDRGGKPATILEALALVFNPK